MRRKILIVDDDLEASEALRDVLEFEGYSVRRANSGDECLRVLRSGYSPDALVVNLVMPGIDGWQLINALAEDAQFGSIPIVLISGKAPVEVRRAVRVLRKPVPLSELLAVLADVTPSSPANPFMN